MATPAKTFSFDNESEAGSAVFEHIEDPVEDVQNYIPGGLHPVHLGDVLGDGRYKILRKLGYGGYSTVWFAQDNSESGSFVALKIARADREYGMEIHVNDVLRGKADQHPGFASIMMLKDHLQVSGPNGDHDCLVYDVMGPSIEDVRDEPPRLYTVAYFTLPSVRKIVHQVLLALDCMHQVGVVHGDLYASNVLFAVKNLAQEPLDILCQSYDEISADVKRTKGPQQLGDPRHLTLHRPLNRFISPNAEVKLADLGNSFFEKSPPSKLETPAHIRSPEMIIDGNASMAQDCWAFGCLVYNMLTNCHPIDSGFVYNKDPRDDTHLLAIIALLGPLPATYKDRWPRYHLYFGSEGQLKKFEVDDDLDVEDTYSDVGLKDHPDTDSPSITSDTIIERLEHKSAESPSAGPGSYLGKAQGSFDSELDPSIIKLFERKKFWNQDGPKSVAEYHALNPPLEERWMAEKHPDIGSEESEAVLDLLQGLFVYDPEKRLSTKDVLRHAWIRDYCVPGGQNDKPSGQETMDSQIKRKRSDTNDKLLQNRKKSVI